MSTPVSSKVWKDIGEKVHRELFPHVGVLINGPLVGYRPGPWALTPGIHGKGYFTLDVFRVGYLCRADVVEHAGDLDFGAGEPVTIVGGSGVIRLEGEGLR